jgi:hypothetical protein
MTHSDAHMVIEPAAARPRTVTVALWLIAASLLVGAAASAVRLVASWSSADSGTSSPWLRLAVYVVMYAILAGLLAALFYRRRWAWWVWLVFFVLGLPASWSGLQHGFDHGVLTGVQYVLSSAADIATAVLLLLGPSRRWYGVGRRPGEPSPWRMSDNPKKS